MTKEDQQLTHAIASVYAKNRIANGSTDYYLVKAHSFDSTSGSFELELGFQAGTEYCCFEPGCHFSLFKDDPNSIFAKIHHELQALGWVYEGRLAARRITIQVEAGALWGLGMRGMDDCKPQRNVQRYEVDPFHEPD